MWCTLYRCEEYYVRPDVDSDSGFHWIHRQRLSFFSGDDAFQEASEKAALLTSENSDPNVWYVVET